jgi:hypothetical protein
MIKANIVLGVDPGTTQTAYALWDGKHVLECDIVPNERMLEMVRGNHWDANLPLFIEMVASYGMPVGKEIFETVLWIGRFVEVWDIKEQPWKLIYRQEVKLFHCHQARAKDSNIAQALRDKYGQVGTKKSPGPLYGVKKDIWSALAIATYSLETFCSTKA